MTLLTKTDLISRINSGKEDQIFIEPLLSENQIGAISVDFRLGYDFLVSVLNSNASIKLRPEENESGPEQFFQSTRRDIGDVFLLHPSQIVLTTSLEYVGLPNNTYADLSSRSSYQRLGISISCTFQPGFRGCLSFELFNQSNVPVELIVGSRIAQARFFDNSNHENYNDSDKRRKYIGNVRPVVSRAPLDEDLAKLG